MAEVALVTIYRSPSTRGWTAFIDSDGDCNRSSKPGEKRVVGVSEVGTEESKRAGPLDLEGLRAASPCWHVAAMMVPLIGIDPATMAFAVLLFGSVQSRIIGRESR